MEERMKKLNTLTKITNSGVVAVVRGDSVEEAIQISDACVKGGILNIEITFTIKDAADVIKQLTSIYTGTEDIVVGAGTVLDAVTARIAMLAGAQFIVSPAFDLETAKLCNLYQIPYMPGCMTISEMKNALESGVDIVKLFPGSNYSPEFVKAIKAPLPQVNLMPTGGIDLNNIEKWIQYGCVVVGIGGSLLAPSKTGNFTEITSLARKYVEKVQKARVNKS
jgi:2-dehydro-3-deoxyphosphogluconate aldolase / (4S)-4-hydroxy-2-oxoglutarate aldolase